METYSVNGVTVSVFYDTRYLKDDLTFPVKYRVTHKGKRAYYSAGIDLTEETWKKLPGTKKKELIEIRELIQAGFDRIKNHIKDLVKEEGFSWQGLNNRLRRKVQNSIISEFTSKIERLEEEGRPGSASAYQCALNSIRSFTSKDLKFTDITPEWLQKYEKYMTDEGRSITTIGMYLRALRAILNEGKSFMTADQYPFGSEKDKKYEIKTGTGRKMALTLSQIKAVIDYPLLTENENRMRDLWFFSYLCNGINFNDMLKLKYRNIASGEIHFVRQKTKRTSKEQKEISATLLPEMEAIIKKWGNPKKPDNHIFPFLKNGLTPAEEKLIVKNVIRLVNKKMAKISKALNYDSISTYTARHSFATVLKRSGANIAFISESLGHSDTLITQHYLDSFESEERAKNAAKLVQFE